MTNRPVSDDFDTILQSAFADITSAMQPRGDLADRLLDDVRKGRRPVTRLGAKQSRRWAMPLLAAASIVAIAVAIVALANLGGHARHPHPPINSVSVPPPKSPALPQFHAIDLYFADTQHGWALGDAQCKTGGHSNCPALLATADGGGSWHALPAPTGIVSTFNGPSCGTNGTSIGPCVDHVLFANSSVGYLWSLHDIYWTTNGGQHWQRFVDPQQDWDGASRMIVAGDRVLRLAPVQQCSAGCPGAVETAPVGTTDWQVTTPPGVQVGLYGSALASVQGDVYLFAAGTADHPNFSATYRSSDGGRQWQRVQHLVCGGSRVADDGALIAVCPGVPLSTIRVAPAGTTDFSGPRRLPTNVDGVAAAQSAQRMIAADASRLSLEGQSFIAIYVTTDGGQNWQRTTTLPTRSTPTFASGSFGTVIATGGTHYYVTDDGGISWQDETFSR